MSERVVTVRVTEEIVHEFEIIVTDDDFVDGSFYIDPDDQRITDMVSDNTVVEVKEREVEIAE